MTNRQARREQRRSQRNQRPQRGPSRPSSRKPQPSPGGGPGSFFSLPYLIGVGVLIVLLGGALLFMTMRGGDDQHVELLEAAEERFPHELAEGLAVGDADAPVTLVSYIDFRCPFCLRFAAEDEPEIIEEYVEAGLVRLETRHLPVLGDESVIAAEAAQCAVEQGSGWEMHNKLFIEHARDGTGTGNFNRDAVKGYARDIGLDGQEFDACIDGNQTIEEVQDQRAEAQAFGFTGTPSFLINGTPLGGPPAGIEGWRTILDSVLAELDGQGETADEQDNGDAGEGDDAAPEDDGDTPDTDEGDEAE